MLTFTSSLHQNNLSLPISLVPGYRFSQALVTRSEPWNRLVSVCLVNTISRQVQKTNVDAFSYETTAASSASTNQQEEFFGWHSAHTEGQLNLQHLKTLLFSLHDSSTDLMIFHCSQTATLENCALHVVSNSLFQHLPFSRKVARVCNDFH